MTDITELALLVSKAKASVFTLEYISQFEPADIDSDDVDLRFEVDGRDTGTNASIVDECGQAAKVIVALVEALEKAQQENTDGVAGMAESYETTISMLRSRIAELESFRTAYMEWGDKTDWVRTDRRFDVVKPLGKHLADVLRAYIEHLESRTVAVKQGEVLVTVAGFTGCGKSAIAGEIEIAMKAIGVPVTWANGDSEKRMTGADWLTAIEMYKPTVRIVEVNIPRPAGIKVEAE
ncbi:TPA: hypothetical protein ACHV7N_004789 [Klebsiella pneumoniae]